MVMILVEKGGKRERYLAVDDFQVRTPSGSKSKEIVYRPKGKTSTSMISTENYSYIALWNDSLTKCLMSVEGGGENDKS